MARPTIFKQNTLHKLEEAFALGCTDKEACIYANIAPSSLYNYQKSNEEFLERKQLLRQTPILKARIELLKGLAGNPMLALKFLEHKKRDEFGRSDVSIDIKLPSPIYGGLSNKKLA